jgi:hypothetical protein
MLQNTAHPSTNSGKAWDGFNIEPIVAVFLKVGESRNLRSNLDLASARFAPEYEHFGTHCTESKVEGAQRDHRAVVHTAHTTSTDANLIALSIEHFALMNTHSKIGGKIIHEIEG